MKHTQVIKFEDENTIAFAVLQLLSCKHHSHIFGVNMVGLEVAMSEVSRQCLITQNLNIKLDDKNLYKG